MAKWSALSDLQFGGPGFEPHPDHYLVVPSSYPWQGKL